MVVDGVTDSLAVECDGDRWHTLDREQDDVARQMTLERLGWRFVRIRGGEYFRHPERALEFLWKRLEELGIHPVETNGAPTPTEGITNEIIADARRHHEKAPTITDTVAEAAFAQAPHVTQQRKSPAPMETLSFDLATREFRKRATRVTQDLARSRSTSSQGQGGRPGVPDRLQAAFAYAQLLTLERLSPAARQVYQWLQDNPEWHGRTDILDGSGIGIEHWQAAINELMCARLVQATGSRRIMQYRVTGK